MRSFLLWLVSLIATAIAIAISYQWLDRPIARFAYTYLRHGQGGIFKLALIPDPLVVLAAVGFVVVGLYIIFGKSLSKLQTTIFVCSTAVIVGELVKGLLKFVFGRTWPEAWINNSPSFISSGAYGFHLFHGGGGYQSFPSGHTGAACAVLAVLWIWYPRLRWVYVVAGAMVGAGLVATDYHFLSDVLAGAFVGASMGWAATAAWKLWSPRKAWRGP